MWNRLWMLPLCGLLTACSEPKIEKFEGFAQGTTYHISYWAAEAVDAKAVETVVEKEFDAIDSTLSNYRPDSTIENFNSQQTTDPQLVGPEIVSLFKVAQTVSQISHGCYDLTIKPLFELWGFRGEALTIPDDETLRRALGDVGMDKLEADDANHLRKKQATVRVDLSSIAQGYSVGRISQILEQQGIANYLVEIGGELKTHGHKPDGTAWRVAVEKPLPGERSLHKIITLPKDTPMAVMTSGTYRHYFDVDGRRYSHILDARNGRPVTHDLVGVTVIHENPTIADAWSTALLCLGQQDGLQAANAEKIMALFVRQQDKELLEMRSEALNAASNLKLE